MKHYTKHLVILIIWLGQTAGYAQPTSHALVEGFPDSLLVSTDFEQNGIYRLILGRLQRSRGIVIAESEERIRGDISKLIFEIPPEYSAQDVYDYFRNSFSDKGYDELFGCVGRECGSSNYWANDIFRNRVLYGPERNQYFLNVRAHNRGSEPSHISLYVITRGNRRTYAYLEIVEPPGTSGPIQVVGKAFLADIEEDGAISLNNITFRSDDQLHESVDLSELALELLQRPQYRFYVVSHFSAEGNLDQLLARSNRRAEAVRLHLISLGVPGTQLISRGLGPLAPLCAQEQCAERVELVQVQDAN